jgi:CxxC motif-containing protein (DUF1111 family)
VTLRRTGMTFWTVVFAALVPLSAGTVSLVAAPLAEPSGLEAGEDLPGGAATSREKLLDRDAFSQFSNGIGFEGESKFKIGNAIFRRLWVAAPSSTKASDGLGPLYNARGCPNCHLKDAGDRRLPTTRTKWPSRCFCVFPSRRRPTSRRS